MMSQNVCEELSLKRKNTLQKHMYNEITAIKEVWFY